MEGLAGTASIIAVVQVADRILTLCGKYALAVKDAKKDVERLTTEVASLEKVLKRVDEIAKSDAMKLYTSRPVVDELDGIIRGCQSTFCELEAQLDPGKGRKTMSRFGIRALKWPFKSKDVTDIIEALNRHKCTINLALNLDQSTNFGLAEQDRQIDKLPYANDAAFNSHLWEYQPRCLPNTRVQLRQTIDDWYKNPNSACIFWLRGMAGTGKSTIARTVADSCVKEEQLGASFFFSRGRGDLGHARKFFTTIASQLAGKDPSLRYYISKAISDNPHIIREGLGEQWKHLIFQPLLQLEERSSRPQTLVLVIDALDECEGEDEVRVLLQLLPKVKGFRKVNVRIFITSRPETQIRLPFHQMSQDAHRDFSLHDIGQEIAQQDIYVFLSYELEEIRKEYGLQRGWPSNQSTQLLAHKASGLFIYAATACRFIRSTKYSLPEDCLALLLHDSSTSSPDRMLDKMYTQVLEHSIIGDRDGQQRELLSAKFREIAGPIVVLFDILTSTSLSKLMGYPERIVLAVLSDLHSVLDIPDNQNHPIQLLHPSFRDFLLDSARCSDHFWIDQKKTHKDLAESCLRVMADHLKRDICGLQNPGVSPSTVPDKLIQKCLPKELQYACRYWVQHLQRGETIHCDDGGVYSFLQENLLYWFEALSLIGKTSEGVLAIISLESMVVADQSPSLHAFIYDAKRFILCNRWVIEEAPLQIYCSALIFAPEKSVIREHSEKHIPNWIYKRPKMQRNWNWSTALQTLEGHSDLINAVAFSPDGKLVASASDDQTVRLWDPVTGISLQSLEGHLSTVDSVAFSPDGKLVASASGDKTIKLWDPVTGALLRILEGHLDRATSVVFSPDGKLMASASSDKTVRLWDPTTGASLQTLEGHLDKAVSVVFSLDGKLVASASRDQTVRLWDPVTGASLQTFEGHSGFVTSVAFSPDSKLVASASWDSTVRLWDVVTGVSLKSLGGHSELVEAVAFSLDGKLVASASFDRMVRLWDPVTGTLLQTLKGHLGPVSAVTFSPDSKLVASASWDKTVRLWDPVTGAPLKTPDGGSDVVDTVAFSPDGKLVASTSLNKMARLWDPMAGVPLRTLEGHLDSVTSVAFSPDSKLVASASRDETVRIWDPATGASLQTLKGHSGGITSMTFSLDGKLVASSSSDKTVRLWDPVMGVPLQTLKSHLSSVNFVAFSHDSKLVTSASWDKTVKLWDSTTGTLLQTFKGHSEYVASAAFSPDSKLVASACWDKTVRLWDSVTGALLQTLEGHSHSVITAAFSPDGKLVASASWDATIRFWDPATGASLGKLETDIAVRKLSFSSDGQHLDTDRGKLSIGLFFPEIISPRSKSVKGGGIFVKDTWVVQGMEKVLLLPPDYRATCVAVSNDILVMGHVSGGVSMIGFNYS